MLANEIPGFDRLTPAEKIMLVEDLWDRIAEDEVSLPVPEGHLRELEIRLQKHRANPNELLTLEEIQQKLLRSK